MKKETEKERKGASSFISHMSVETGHGSAWTPSTHYAGGQCGQSCPCCRFDEARERPPSSWLGVCTICAHIASRARGKKRKRAVDPTVAPRAKRSRSEIK